MSIGGGKLTLNKRNGLGRIQWGRDMKKILLASVATAALCSASAFAADMPVKAAPYAAPAFNWTGFYIGLNGGGGSSHKCWTETNDIALGVGIRDEGCHDATGGTVGGQIGYRWQATNWVFGVEVQGNWANFSGSNTNLFPAFANVRDTSKIDAFGMLTGSVGYAWNNYLLYVKGGAAVVSDKYNTNFITTNVLIDQAKETRWGGVIGAGIEFGFAPNWSFGVEYDHMFLGTRDVTATGVGNGGIPVGGFSATDRGFLFSGCVANVRFGSNAAE
jgi:outer membrane immunogenic protein